MKTYDVTDPHGFVHRVYVDGSGAHGVESIAHHVDDRKERMRITSLLLNALVFDKPLPEGYSSQGVLL